MSSPMASTSLRRRRVPVPSTRAGSSAAQADLAKIIAIISTVPHPPTPPPEVAVNLDLLLELTPGMYGRSSAVAPAADVKDDGIPTAQTESCEASTVEKISEKAPANDDSIWLTQKSSQGECFADAARLKKEGAKEISDNTSSSCKKDEYIHDNGEVERSIMRRKAIPSEGYIGLLLEAVRQVSGERNNNEGEGDEKASVPAPLPSPRAKKKTSARSKRRRTCWSALAVEFFEETEPVVRSKRGRSQALPSRYRDSVLEPWRKQPGVSYW